MKKTIVFLAVLLFSVLFTWISCNKFKTAETDEYLSVLDETSGARLTISCTIIVTGSTWDGGGAHIDSSGLPRSKYDPAPIFSVANGAVQNVVLDPPATYCIVLSGNCTVSNVNIPELDSDFMGIYTYTGDTAISDLTVGQAYGTVLYVGDVANVTLKNITCKNGNKFMYNYIRGTTFYIDTADFSNLTESISNNYGDQYNTVYWRNITCNLPQASWFTGNANVSTY